jgi:APA family basic amino acid/polyamine antiporter
MEQLQKKYGFWTATAMVVGIVIGSGVFFKADDVLFASGGRLPVALLAWLIGGGIMVVTAYTFSRIATRVEKVNGIVDYFEAAYGETAGYYVAWFMTIVYYPTLVSVLAWVSANYTVGLVGWTSAGALWGLAAAYLVGFFLLNIYSPVLAGKWQVSATVIKLIPLALVAVVGLATGLVTGQTFESFAQAATNVGDGAGGLAVATLATAFAYEGWIIATSINAELRDARRTLPRALVAGTITVVIVYMTYYLGISGVLSNTEVLAAGDGAPVEVISLVFGVLGGTVLTVFVIISCLGTLNGLIMGSARGLFAIASRGVGPAPRYFSQVAPETNSTQRSAVVGLALSLLWLGVWYGNFAGWWGGFMDISELPIAFLYAIYLAIYLWVIRTFQDDGPLGRVIAPTLAALGSLYIIWGAVQKDLFIVFVVVTAVIMGVGAVLRGRHRSRNAEVSTP